MTMEKILDKIGTVVKRYIPETMNNDLNIALGYNSLLAFDVISEKEKHRIVVKQDNVYSNIYRDDKVKIIKYKYIFDDYYEMKDFLTEEINLNYANFNTDEKMKKLQALLPSKNLFGDNNYSIIKYDIKKVGKEYD